MSGHRPKPPLLGGVKDKKKVLKRQHTAGSRCAAETADGAAAATTTVEKFRGKNPKKKVAKVEASSHQADSDTELDDTSEGKRKKRSAVDVVNKEMKALEKKAARLKDWKKIKEYIDTRLWIFEKLLKLVIAAEVRQILREPRPSVQNLRGLPLSIASTPVMEEETVESGRFEEPKLLSKRGKKGPSPLTAAFSQHVEGIVSNEDYIGLGNLFFLFARGDVTRCDPHFFGAFPSIESMKQGNILDWEHQKGKNPRIKVLEETVVGVANRTTVDNNNLISKMFEAVHNVFYKEFNKDFPSTIVHF
uniref:Uncharacterized protein n=1 Tax=Chromera velia CCMP2878 TaxID=1169474 RepID=A0A0G4H3U4_9ALVE|eukprot:Cvel_24581.t1-p1 / transcript=Cvel_24581.t1 / gene=Cvel_24581 / organism=Chromera_velia_CCMP2878 / gene_product=hypothetical protein / transcript_product=hypothetical protein / location=Cvel_scaffold2675:15084-16266(-) / protein_length=303 / sequence_SO=supercontig / SO=protein_coding / is_pseudo=false